MPKAVVLSARELSSVTSDSLPESEMWRLLEAEKAGKARPYILNRIYQSASKARRMREQSEIAQATCNAQHNRRKK